MNLVEREGENFDELELIHDICVQENGEMNVYQFKGAFGGSKSDDKWQPQVEKRRIGEDITFLKHAQFLW